jgi:hypothetical protein
MINKTAILFGSLVLGLALLSAPRAQADQWNKKTVITVNEPMRIPGLTLQPGKYVLKLADSSANRHIVQVFNEDESQILATILAIPNERLEPTGDTVLELWETPKAAPRALRAWFYPGDNFGQEFSYPKDEATALTAEVHHEVPALSDEDQAALSKSSQSSPSAAAPSSTEPAQAQTSQEQPAANSNSEMARADTGSTNADAAQTAPAQTTPEPADQGTAVSTDSRMADTQAPQTDNSRTDMGMNPAASDSATSRERTELPRTASYLPIIGLSGLLALGAATVLRNGMSR